MSKKTKTKKEKKSKQKPEKKLTDYPAKLRLESSTGEEKEFPLVTVNRGCAVVRWGMVGGEVKFFLTTGYLYPRGKPRNEANWRIDYDQLEVLRKCAKQRGWKAKPVVSRPYRSLVGDGKFGCEIASLGLQ